MRKLSRPILIAASIAVTLVVISVALLWYTESENAAFAQQSGSGRLVGENGLPYVTDEIELDAAAHVLDDVRAGRIDLLAELRRLRGQCPDEYTKDQCDTFVFEFLERVPDPDGPRLVELFRTYRSYEAAQEAGALREYAGQSLTLEQKYELVKQKRRAMFGAEDAALVFGLEETQIAYQNLIQKVTDGAYANLPPAERLAKIEAERTALFGPYAATLREREPEGARYGLELLARQTELAGMSEADRTRAVHELRVRYFGGERAAEIAESERGEAGALAERNEKLERFLAAEQEYLSKNPEVPAEERRAHLEELRARIYSD